MSDGTDNAIDGYGNNANELTVTNQVPSLTAGTTAATPASVQAVGANATVLSATFDDLEQPGVGAFTVTFRVREPDDTTELTLANAAPNGSQGVTIVDNGGGSYTASLSWDPADGQTLGAYDLYFEVNDGIDSAIDGFAANTNELALLDVVPNEVPVVSAGATTSSPASVYPAGSGTVTLSAAFSDADVPGVGAFTVGFSVRQPDDSTVVVVVTNSGDGVNGVTISDSGGPPDPTISTSR